ncbi:MAG: DNA adenine methylase [Planctomycetes bacterium]|nr:DNA adenine methylase [Planctomycetota bacterium]
MSHGPMKQRAEFTHKHNLNSGRHGWLRLTPAYSVKLVSEILCHYDKAISVIDPFSGTGTSVLAAAEQEHSAIGVDINPFLVWLGNAKLAKYTPSDLATALAAVAKILRSEETFPAQPPSIHNIYRWWHPEVLSFLCKLRGQIRAIAKKHSKTANLLDVIFCQTIIKLSNAAFNHQSMSFADDKAEYAHTPEVCIECFRDNARIVLESLAPNPSGKGTVVLGDSKAALPGNGYDLLITSPPYPNRISYIRELRPYMYWLGYLKEAREAGELDWKAIGGTWGVATSRLTVWKPEPDMFLPVSLGEAVSAIHAANGMNGRLLAAYVHKYFCDMWRHFQTIKDKLKTGAKVVYIVGNSSFYGVMVPAEQIYAEMLDMAGFVNIRIETIRKRNSKKELFEYAVEADYATASPMGQIAAIGQAYAPTLF